MLDRGYVVAATDYPGLGLPRFMPISWGQVRGIRCSNSVPAARAIPEAAAGTRFSVWGHSQGGQAALFTDLEAARYAPELKLVGVAAAAPATDLGALMTDDEARRRNNITAMTLWSWARVSIIWPRKRRGGDFWKRICRGPLPSGDPSLPGSRIGRRHGAARDHGGRVDCGRVLPVLCERWSPPTGRGAAFPRVRSSARQRLTLGSLTPKRRPALLSETPPAIAANTRPRRCMESGSAISAGLQSGRKLESNQRHFGNPTPIQSVRSARQSREREIGFTARSEGSPNWRRKAMRRFRKS